MYKVNNGIENIGAKMIGVLMIRPPIKLTNTKKIPILRKEAIFQ
jgi:hypothetical protein